jgi:Ca-activated chloride channel homolog
MIEASLATSPAILRARRGRWLAALIRWPYLTILGALLIALGLAGWRVGFANLVLTPDQRGRFLFERGRYDKAAKAFRDPMWLGTAQMKAKAFKDAAQTSAGSTRRTRITTAAARS